jgi:phage baseplate assembly protein W|tara:strand:+ start:18261 stop:18740 length:480 start_codon:yes stop_codon:yes gene_type:complete
MANYKITSLNNVVFTDNEFIFKDLALDLEMGYSNSNEFYKNNEILDLKADVDHAAIRNSIFNLFNTNQGERLLNPDFGLNLKNYLFEAVSKEGGIMIGDTIKSGIMKYEPRISVDRITVVVDEDNNTYEITLIVTAKALQNRVITLPGLLSNSGFRYIQ